MQVEFGNGQMADVVLKRGEYAILKYHDVFAAVMFEGEDFYIMNEDEMWRVTYADAHKDYMRALNT